MEITRFTKYKQDQSNNIDIVDSRRFESCVGGGTVDPVCEVDTGEDPVVGAVLEDVSHGHGCQGELVDVERLVLAFYEVQDYHGHREHLGEGEGRTAVAVEVGTEQKKGEVDEDWAGVFDYEDCEPGDLGTWCREWLALDGLEGQKGAYQGL